MSAPSQRAPGPTVRRPGPGDEAAWRGLWTGYLDFYETTVAEEVYAASWARLLSEA